MWKVQRRRRAFMPADLIKPREKVRPKSRQGGRMRSGNIQADLSVIGRSRACLQCPFLTFLEGLETSVRSSFVGQSNHPRRLKRERRACSRRAVLRPSPSPSQSQYSSPTCLKGGCIRGELSFVMSWAPLRQYNGPTCLETEDFRKGLSFLPAWVSL